MAEDRWVELTLREPRGLRILGKVREVGEHSVTGMPCVVLTECIRMGEEVMVQQREVEHGGQKVVIPDVIPVPFHLPVTLLCPRFSRDVVVEIPTSNIALSSTIAESTVMKFRNELLGSNIKPVGGNVTPIR